MATTRVGFESNLGEKLGHPLFVAGITPLLRPGAKSDLDSDADLVRKEGLGSLG